MISAASDEMLSVRRKIYRPNSAGMPLQYSEQVPISRIPHSRRIVSADGDDALIIREKHCLVNCVTVPLKNG